MMELSPQCYIPSFVEIGRLVPEKMLGFLCDQHHINKLSLSCIIMKADTLNRLRRNDRAMIRWICNVKAKDEVSSDSLLTKLGIQDLDVVLRTGRMRWFGHVERSTGWISEVRKLNVVAQKRSGRPRKSGDEVIKNDRKKLDMDSADPQNRSEWRGRLRGRLVKKPNPW